MKLRISSNSVRLRLVQDEVLELIAGHSIQEIIILPNESSFLFSIEIADCFDLLLNDGKMVAKIPADVISSWQPEQDVTARHDFELKDNKRLTLLIEKDFHG